jgi:hypothetical protein
LLGYEQLVTVHIVPPPHLSLDCPLHIRERKRRIAITGKFQRVFQEAKLVGQAGEPYFIKSMEIVMGVMRCTA